MNKPYSPILFVVGILLLFPLIINTIMKFSVGIDVVGDEKTWITFWGNVGGGFLTLIGVYFTLQYSRKANQRLLEFQLKERRFMHLRELLTENAGIINPFPIALMNSRLVLADDKSIDTMNNELGQLIFDIAIYKHKLSIYVKNEEYLSCIDNYLMKYHNTATGIAERLTKIKNIKTTNPKPITAVNAVYDEIDELVLKMHEFYASKRTELEQATYSLLKAEEQEILKP